MNNSKIKILISYHKPSVLLKDDILTPIHVGRALATEASKEGSMSEEDYQWMLDNMIGDDTGDNISYLNREFYELTAIYWAWKNYDKLGNPEYIGFMFHNKLFNFSDNNQKLFFNKELNIFELNNIDYNTYLENYYNINKLFSFINNNQYVVTQFYNQNNKNICNYDEFNILINNHFSQYNSYLDLLKDNKKKYYSNMFILPKKCFFDYCNLIFTSILDILDNTNTTIFDIQNMYYISKIIASYFFDNLSTNNNVKELDVINIINSNITYELFPKNNNGIHICFSCNDNYLPYLAVTIKSIICNSNENNYYEIYILEKDISDYNKNIILNMSSNNVYIKFINIYYYLQNINENDFFVNRHFSVEMYYRIFIPRIFKNFSRILYLDSDLIILKDIAILFNINLNNKILAAALDMVILIMSNNLEIVFGSNSIKTSLKEYLLNYLKLKTTKKYFQSGVILFDVKECIKFNLENKCMEKLYELKEFLNPDQDILNCICEDYVHFFNISWNLEWNIDIEFYDKINNLNYENYYNYIKAYNAPNIIHYCSHFKPWVYTNYKKSYYWWKYARMTEYYESILLNNNNNNNNTVTIFSLGDFLFSIKENNNYKIITIFGIKITIKKENK